MVRSGEEWHSDCGAGVGGRQGRPSEGRRRRRLSRGREGRTQRGEESGAVDAGAAADEATRGLWGATAQAVVPCRGIRGGLLPAARMLSWLVWGFAVLSRLIENRSQLIALVATLGEETGEIRCWKVPVTKVRQQLPDLLHDSEISKRQ